MKKISFLFFVLVSFIALSHYLFYQPGQMQAKTTQTSPSKVIIYYLHNNFRCPSCLKIESYTREAIKTNFANQLKDSTLELKVINFDENANKHYVEDYQLYTKSVVLSKVKDGKQTQWKNLDKIWTLLGDKAKFQQYIKTETANFLKGSK